MDQDFVLKNELLPRVETIPRDDFDCALGARLSVNAESHVGVSTTADDLANPVHLSHVSVVLYNEVVRLDEHFFDPRDHVAVVRIFIIHLTEAHDLL